MAIAPHIDEDVLAAYEPPGDACREARRRLVAAIAAVGPVDAEPAWLRELGTRKRLLFADPIHGRHWCAVLAPDPEATSAGARAVKLAAAVVRLRDELGADAPGSRAFLTTPAVAGGNALTSTREANHFVALVRGVAYRVVDPAALATLAGATGGTLAPAAATSWPRPAWAELRARFARTEENRESLHVVESALFAISLEPELRPENAEDIGRAAHGRGFGNRWHDKGLQLVVFGNGAAAVIGSFAAGLDGQLGIVLAERIWQLARDVAITSSDAPLPLAWELTEPVRDALVARASAAGVDTRAWFQHAAAFGALKAAGVNADACIHTAVQAAVLERFGPDLLLEHREFVANDRVDDGGLTTISVITRELDTSVRALLAGELARPALVATSERHVQRIRAAKSGELPLQWASYLAERSREVSAALDAWLAAGGGARVFDSALFWTPYGRATDRVLVMSSGLRLLAGVALFGRFGVRRAQPALCFHYFATASGVDFVWHGPADAYPQLARLDEAVARHLARLVAIALA